MLNSNNELVSNEHNKAELFNTYLCSVSTNEDTNSLPTFMVPSFITPIESVDLTVGAIFKKLLSIINIAKSPGPYGWHLLSSKQLLILYVSLYTFYLQSLYKLDNCQLAGKRVVSFLSSRKVLDILSKTIDLLH